MLNKSFITNFVSFIFVILGYFSPYYPKEIFNIGIFALSGAITNWLAVHMLFEKVPGLYGSGVIPARFEEFKMAIKDLMMKQFFSEENLDRFFHNNGPNSSHENSIVSKIDFTAVIETLDYDQIFNNLLEVVSNSPLGGMLAMFGGANALTPLKEPFTEKMKHTIFEITKSDQFLNALENNMLPNNMSSEVKNKVESLVDGRLNELTPTMVKEIVQEMIQKHLGWLVVWGGVLGGFIGLITSFIQ